MGKKRGKKAGKGKGGKKGEEKKRWNREEKAVGGYVLSRRGEKKNKKKRPSQKRGFQRGGR